MTFQPGDIVKHKNFPGAVAVVVEDIPEAAVCINWVLPPVKGAYFRQDHPDCDYMATAGNLTLIQKGESK